LIPEQVFLATNISIDLPVMIVLNIINFSRYREYGNDWHHAGSLANKQNVFDDFISAGEELVKQKYTSPSK